MSMSMSEINQNKDEEKILKGDGEGGVTAVSWMSGYKCCEYLRKD